MTDAGQGRPEDLPGVETEVGESPAVMPDEAGEAAFIVRAEIAPVKGAEVAHGYHVLDEYAAAFQVGLAKEIFVLETEVELQCHHSGGGEMPHS